MWSEPEVTDADDRVDDKIVVTPPGLGVEAWAPRIAAAPRVTLAELLAEMEIPAAEASLIVLGAHPDDESLGCGRLMSMWRRHAGEVTAVLATAGEACLAHLGRAPVGLARRRMVEWQEATEDLGVADRFGADVPDGRVEEHRAQVRRVLMEAVRAAPRPAVVAAPWRRDPHPDHRACGELAAEIADELGVALLEYPVWMTFWRDPSSTEGGSPHLIRVVTDATADRDHDLACSRYVSQIAPLADDLTAVVPPAMLEHHRQQLLVAGPLDEQEHS